MPEQAQKRKQYWIGFTSLFPQAHFHSEPVNVQYWEIPGLADSRVPVTMANGILARAIYTNRLAKLSVYNIMARKDERHTK